VTDVVQVTVWHAVPLIGIEVGPSMVIAIGAAGQLELVSLVE
jgi:hypothetical protein